MRTRRAFVRDLAGAGATVWAWLRDDGLERLRAADRAAGLRSPEELAGEEDFWREIQQAFTVDRTLINLNNGGVSPSPRVVQDAMRRYLELSNQAPVYTMWELLDPGIETVRRRLAASFGCDPEEIAITRNASEAMETCILGLDLKPGDEVLTTDQDYPRMLTTWRQREQREGVVLRTIPFPPPPKKPLPKGAPPPPPPKFATNWELSAARALTVVHYLQDTAKLDPSRLAALAFGQYRPVSRSNKAANRRIEIVLYPHRAVIEKR